MVEYLFSDRSGGAFWLADFQVSLQPKLQHVVQIPVQVVDSVLCSILF
jgi:hypothetical protein